MRSYVVAMFKRGELASLQEGAVVGGVNKVTVRRWLVEAKVNWGATRTRWLAKCNERAARYAEGLPPIPRLTKRQMSQLLARQKADWDRKNGRNPEIPD